MQGELLAEAERIVRCVPLLCCASAAAIQRVAVPARVCVHPPWLHCLALPPLC